MKGNAERKEKGVRNRVRIKKRGNRGNGEREKRGWQIFKGKGQEIRKKIKKGNAKRMGNRVKKLGENDKERTGRGK